VEFEHTKDRDHSCVCRAICREAVDFIIYIAYNEKKGMPMIEKNLAQTVDAANNAGSANDTDVTYLLLGKQILSWIL